MPAVVPTAEQFQRLVEDGPDGPIVIVNLLKYRRNADYEPDRPEAKENLSGLDAYRRYGVVALQHVTARGGSIIWGGARKMVVIGDCAANDWDEIVVCAIPLGRRS